LGVARNRLYKWQVEINRAGKQAVDFHPKLSHFRG